MNRLLLLFALLVGTGCTISYPIHAPRTSGVRYEGPQPARKLELVDARPAGSKFSDGRVNIRLKFDGDQSELAYLQQNVTAELAVRGVPGTGAELVQGTVREFGVRNRRVSGFSPMVTFTRLSADFVQGAKTVRIVAYSKQTKTPVWSMGELEQPLFNRPLHAVVGELAAKLNRHFVGGRASDADVAQLSARAATVQGDALLQVVNELGWSNHPAALQPLLTLTAHDNEDVRGTALGALGTLGQPQALDPLRRAYEAGQSHTDRLMALKSIGDLGTPDAQAFLLQVQNKPGDDAQEKLEITRLFLDTRAIHQGAPSELQASR